MKIIYTGLLEETLCIIKDNLPFQEALFLPISESEISSAVAEIKEGAVLLIGEKANNPIQLTQQAYGMDPHISIIIINEAASYHKIKQSLLFTPFIGPTVHSVSNIAGKGLGSVVKDHIQRTEQRRNYKKFQKNFSISTAPPIEKFERVKTDYLHRVLEEAPVGLVLINRGGNILSFNSYSAAFFIKSEREVLGTALADLFPEKERAMMKAFLSEAEGLNLHKTIEFQRENTSRFVEIKLSRVDKGDSSYKVVLINEITEKIIAQKSIEESAQKVKMIVESMPEMAWTALPNGAIDYLNRRWYEYTGQHPYEPFATSWKRALHPEDLERAASLWELSLRKGTLYQLECRYFKLSDNAYRWHLTRACPVRSSDGAILHWVGTCTDIQSLKDTEEELQIMAEELAASNEELTAANEEIRASMEELHESNEQLIKVNTDMDNFIYTASHDLKAPILNVEGLVKILSRKLGKEAGENVQLQEMLEMINFSIQRFKGTIEDLTEIVKLQRLSEMEAEPASIPEIVHEVELDLYQQLLEADAELEMQVEGEALVTFSHKNLKSIIYNLLSNAVKYRSPERKPIINIAIYPEEEFTVLAIKDNGVGMNLKSENKIFGMFQRMHSHVEGSGIGLYIVKKIVEGAGGKIKVESRVGEGSAFYVYFLNK